MCNNLQLTNTVPEPRDALASDITSSRGISRTGGGSKLFLGLSEIFIFAFHHLFEETFENDCWKNISGNQYLAHLEEKK